MLMDPCTLLPSTISFMNSSLLSHHSRSREGEKTNKMKNKSKFLSEKPRQLTVIITAMFAGAILILTLIKDTSLLPSLSTSKSDTDFPSTTPTQLNTILHYATSRIVPQQTIDEIRISFDVLAALAPCNFLIFGLGHDSLMWSAFNSQGTTLFLEEDPRWVQSVLKDAPNLNAQTVRYKTHLSESNQLLSTYKDNPHCAPNERLPGNTQCKLALGDLPDEVYNKEWDLIMIDAPRGYFPDAPGRMSAIFSAAVMARARKGSGVTHVFLHDVNRRVERIYAMEFLCKKYLAKAVGRLWHFEIPPAANLSSPGFC